MVLERNFLARHSSAVHNWAKGITLCHQTDVILLDFSKAFHTVPHECLLAKLDFNGIRGKMLVWIKASLSNSTCTWINTDVRGIYLTYFMKLFMKDLYIAILCSRGQTPAN